MSALRGILVTAPNFDEPARAFLAAHGCRAVMPAQAEGGLSEGELIALLRGVHGWIIGPQADVTRALIAAAPSCLVFSRRGVGFERLDVGALADLERVGVIASGGNGDSVADHVIGLMLGAGRRMRELQNAMLQGDWSIRVGGDLFQKTVGIIGLGRTGRALARRLRGFEARILVCAPRPDLEFCAANGITIVDFPALLRGCDYISLHAPLTRHTRHMMGAPELAAMKPSAILINTARGGLVDDAALLAALRAGVIAGAGLDVFEGEGDAALMGIARELSALPSVVATPHVAGSTREGLARTNLIAAQNVVAALDGLEIPNDCIIADGRPRDAHDN